MDCINYRAQKEVSSMGILFSMNRGRKAGNQKIEFDVIVPGRAIQAGEAADIR